MCIRDRIGVDADTNYYVMNLFHISSQLGQNSAYLLSADYDIVRPCLLYTSRCV